MSDSDHTMTEADLARVWDERHRDAEAVQTPSLVLRAWPHLLPTAGDALDLACGLGVDALWLAARGLRVAAWDRSAVAIERLEASARERGLRIDAEARDLTTAPPPPERFDLILVAHFLDRALCPRIAAALRPGGRLFYQTYTRETSSGRGPRNPAFRLAPNELIQLFPDLILRAYRAEGHLAEPDSPLADLALMVAERPSGAPVSG